MKTTEHPGILILACKRDGAPHTGPAILCDRMGGCGRFLVEFVSSRGARERVPSLPEREVVCVNADRPCPWALKAKKWLDGLQEMSR